MCCVQPGDRYDSEPRSRSKFEPTRYDEDPRGPVRPYSDDDDEGFRDRPGSHKSSKDKKDVTYKDEEEEKEAG